MSILDYFGKIMLKEGISEQNSSITIGNKFVKGKILNG